MRHWGAIAAVGFFTVEVLAHAGLIRCLVFIVIDLACASPTMSELDSEALDLRATSESFAAIRRLRRAGPDRTFVLIPYAATALAYRLATQPHVSRHGSSCFLLASGEGRADLFFADPPDSLRYSNPDEDANLVVVPFHPRGLQRDESHGNAQAPTW